MIKNLDEAIAAVRAELRPGGRPMQTYMDAGFGAEVLKGPDTPAPVLRAASALTTAIILNIEDRLLALEADRPTR